MNNDKHRKLYHMQLVTIIIILKLELYQVSFYQ